MICKDSNIEFLRIWFHYLYRSFDSTYSQLTCWICNSNSRNCLHCIWSSGFFSIIPTTWSIYLPFIHKQSITPRTMMDGLYCLITIWWMGMMDGCDGWQARSTPILRSGGTVSLSRLLMIHQSTTILVFCTQYTGIILCMYPANERRYIVMSTLIDWEHIQNDPCAHTRSPLSFWPRLANRFTVSSGCKWIVNATNRVMPFSFIT